MTTKIELSIVIDRPIDEVFKNATCLKGCVNWQTAVVSTEKLDENRPAEVGARYHHLVKFMGMKTETHPEIIRINPPHEFAYSDTDARNAFETRYLFDEVPGGTRMRVTIQGDLDQNLLGRIAKPVLERALARQFEADLDTLKDLLESGVTVHAQ